MRAKQWISVTDDVLIKLHTHSLKYGLIQTHIKACLMSMSQGFEFLSRSITLLVGEEKEPLHLLTALPKKENHYLSKLYWNLKAQNFSFFPM